MQVFILNLPRLENRKLECINSLIEFGVPAEDINVWSAKDHIDYATVADVCRDAVREGHTMFRNVISCQPDDNADTNKGYMAQSWNYLRFYRHIIENNIEISMLIQDRRKLTIPYSELQGIVSDILDYNPNFHLLTLGSGHSPSLVVKEDLRVKNGISAFASDWCTVISKAGAKYLYESYGNFLTNGPECYIHDGHISYILDTFLNSPMYCNLENIRNIYSMVESAVSFMVDIGKYPSSLHGWINHRDGTYSKIET